MGLMPGFEIEGPSEFFASLWDSIPRNIKIVFCWALVLGFLTHLFVFMNKLPNHDELREFSLMAEHNLSLGRWFRNVIWQLGGAWSTPYIRGTLALLFLSAGSCCVVAALEFRTLFFSLGAASLLAASPVLSSMFAFMFMSDAFQFAMFCAAAAALLAGRSPRGLLLGIPLLVVSLGTYQAYFFFAASLLLILIIRRTALGADRADLLALAVRSAQLLFWALGFYILITKIITVMTQVYLSGYQGVSSFVKGGLISGALHDIPQIASFIYRGFAADAFTAPLDGGGAFVTLCRAALVLAALVMLGLTLWRGQRRERGLRAAMTICCTALLPLALCGLYFVAATSRNGFDGYMHVVMTYSGVLLWVWAVNAADLYAGLPAPAGRPRANARALLLWCAAVCSAVLVWNGYIFNNETYFKMYMGYEKAYAFSVQLTQRIGELKPKRPMPLALVGEPQNVVDNTRIPSRGFRMMTAAFDGPELIGCNGYDLFLRDYLGCRYVSSLARKYEAGSLLRMPEVRAMPLFPAAGSVRIIGGQIVVKLGDTVEEGEDGNDR